MNKVALSPKYQVVIPKSARKTMGLSKTQKVMYVSEVRAGEIVFRTTDPNAQKTTLEQFAGSIKSTHDSPVRHLREVRDTEWE